MDSNYLLWAWGLQVYEPWPFLIFTLFVFQL